MNVKVENQNLIQFPQVDWKSSKRSGEENHAMAVRESFGEILEREFQVHSENLKTLLNTKLLVGRMETQILKRKFRNPKRPQNKN